MSTLQSQKTGYSLIEVLIAIAILMVAIVAPMNIAIRSIQSSQHALEQNTAIFLAQEAISAIEMMRNHGALEYLKSSNDNRWDWTGRLATDCQTADGCNFDMADPYALVESSNPPVVACTTTGENCRMYYNEDWGRAVYRTSDAGGGEETPYTRRIFFDTLTGSEVTVRAEVTWDSHFLGQEQRVSVTSSFFNIYDSF